MTDPRRADLLPTRHSHPDLWLPRTEPRHVPQPRNPRPMSGGPGGLQALYGAQRRAQGGGGGGFIERSGVFVPLQGTNPESPLSGGYGFCDPTDGGQTPHPGADLNAGGSCGADEGNMVVASVAGVVLAVLPWDGHTPGEGNHLWVLYDAPEAPALTWGHFDHLGSFAVSEGQRFQAGQLLGTCSASGGWDCPHLHLELLRQQPSSWWLWPYGWSVAQVEAVYYEPSVWYAETVARAAGQEDDVRTSTTPEEREAVKPYFEMYGIGANMDTALLQRACLAYYREESPGPCLTGEYPWGDRGYVRQQFSARTGEWHPDDNTVYWVELNLKDGEG
jgi:murein DD-endopeptidase MepM/ murein hydrolase activator NlpD